MSQDTVLTVKINGLDKLVSAFERAPQIAEPIYQTAINKSAAVLASHTVSGVVPWKTGTLARSFDPVTIGRLFAKWYPRVNYARILDQGGKTAPHEIRPRNGKALFWRGASHPVKVVHHPGSRFKARHYMKKIASLSREQINGIFKQALKDVISKI